MGGRFIGETNPAKRPEVRKKISEGLKRYASSLSPEERRKRFGVGCYDLEHLRRMGKNSRKHENEVASRLQGDFIFKPNEVCDRIVVRNGKIFFVEIKQHGQKLRPKQKLFSDIVKNRYQIVYA